MSVQYDLLSMKADWERREVCMDPEENVGETPRTHDGNIDFPSGERQVAEGNQSFFTF